MLAQPSMIKRPVLDVGGALIVGFKPGTYARQGVSLEPWRSKSYVRPALI